MVQEARQGRLETTPGVPPLPTHRRQTVGGVHVPANRVPSAPGRGNYAAMPYVYILQCADSSYYVGSTWDLERRLDEHAGGCGAAYTSRRLPVRLVFATEFDRIDEAFAMEKRIQGWSRRKREALIAGRYGDLPSLSARGGRADR